jgi:hypothetical protein
VPKGTTVLVRGVGRDGNNNYFYDFRKCEITDTSINFLDGDSDTTIMRIYGVKGTEDMNYYELP